MLCLCDLNMPLLMYYANIILIRLLLKDCLIFKDVDLMGINLMTEYCLCSIIVGSDAENWNLCSVRKEVRLSRYHSGSLCFWSELVRPLFYDFNIYLNALVLSKSHWAGEVAICIYYYTALSSYCPLFNRWPECLSKLDLWKYVNFLFFLPRRS